MLPPTHRRDPNRTSSTTGPSAEKVRKALQPLTPEELQRKIDEANYRNKNPNSPEALAYREQMERETDLDRAARPTLEAIERAYTITAADLAVYVGPGPPQPHLLNNVI